jgi:hypothetical protein
LTGVFLTGALAALGEAVFGAASPTGFFAGAFACEGLAGCCGFLTGAAPVVDLAAVFFAAGFLGASLSTILIFCIPAR